MGEERRIEFISALFGGGFWAVLSMLWYKITLFRCWTNMSYEESQKILWGILIVMVILGAFIIGYGNNEWTTFKTLAIAYGSYTILTYGEVIRGRVNVILGISIIIASVLAVMIVFRKIRPGWNKRRIIRKRFRKCIYVYCSSIGIGMEILLFTMICSLVFGNSLFQPSIKSTNADTLEEQTIANNMETLLFLQEEEWKKLNIEEKLDIMQTVANIEASYLGLPNELNVAVGNFEETKLGVYQDEIHTIYINLSHLEYDSAQSVLQTCCHEAFHSYQFRLIDAYNSTDEKTKGLRIYKSAIAYLEEFSNYVSGSDDFEEYYGQVCEEDARKYSEEAVIDYYNQIYEYLGIH